MKYKWSENEMFLTLRPGGFFIVKPKTKNNPNDSYHAYEYTNDEHFVDLASAKAWVEERYLIWWTAQKLEGHATP